MRRLVPAYVEKPAWAVYDAVINEAEADDLSDAVEDLRAALLRADAVMYAPDYVLVQTFGGAA